MWYSWSVNENSLKYKIEYLYENLFTISQAEIAILFGGGGGGGGGGGMKWYYMSAK